MLNKKKSKKIKLDLEENIPIRTLTRSQVPKSASEIGRTSTVPSTESSNAQQDREKGNDADTVRMEGKRRSQKKKPVVVSVQNDVDEIVDLPKKVNNKKRQK